MNDAGTQATLDKKTQTEDKNNNRHHTEN